VVTIFFISAAVIVGGFSFGGTPIAVRFQSSDYQALIRAKDLLKDELRQIAGVKDIRDDTPLGNNEFVVTLKPKGQALGFTVRDLTSQLRQGFYGDEVMRLQKGRDEVKVWVRFPKQDRVSIAQIENLKVRTPSGEYVPFKEVAEYQIERERVQVVTRSRSRDGDTDGHQIPGARSDEPNHVGGSTGAAGAETSRQRPRNHAPTRRRAVTTAAAATE